MHLLRFVLPFLFIRNWYSGVWELSRSRCILFSSMMVIVIVGFIIAYVLHAPVEYTASL